MCRIWAWALQTHACIEHTHTHNAHAHAILGTINYFVVDSTPRTYCASVAYSVSIGYKIATIHSQQENDIEFATPRSLRRRALEPMRWSRTGFGPGKMAHPRTIRIQATTA